MKTLLLVRHAKTAPAGPDQTDHARALEDSGVTDAGKLAHYLRKKDLVPEQMLVSSANRTQSTAQILLAAFDGQDIDVVVSDELYLADVSFLEQVVINASDEISTLMIVGHNPGLSELAYQYDQHVQGLHPAQMLRVEFDVKHWANVKRKHVVKTRLV
ncbi:SixA phosphatase family protein [Orrella daihaiensis]|uniref:Histidine phosphatase family protein n=1 Tax=Orrella daihaiensis TaxID=2782176 RepID=A0ABY4APV6_9BURK|nr:histidine phosphatase family protein [Orrella daihaiensis]UOD51067.1 histidine phosphatase family protein [Orrella daihaiensis]